MKRLRYSSAGSACGGLPCGPSAQEMETGGEELDSSPATEPVPAALLKAFSAKKK